MHRCGKCTINESEVVYLYIYIIYTPSLITLFVSEREYSRVRESGEGAEVSILSSG